MPPFGVVEPSVDRTRRPVPTSAGPGRRLGRREVLALSGTVVAGAGLVACAASGVAEVLDDGPAWGWARQAAPLDLGVTHGQDSLDPADRGAGTARGRGILASAMRWQNQHLMGWGALNPEPAPGVAAWASLDDRFRLLRETGGQAVLTVAGAPDWMKGGTPGTTDYSRIEVAPAREYYDDLAALAARTVTRYPDIRAVQVWNEFKGFYDADANGWDAAAYTVLYDAVHAAVKAARPDVLVGGPYVPMDLWSDDRTAPSDLRGSWGVADGRALAAVEYWLAHAAGADFVVVDGGTSTKDRGLVTDPVTAADRFAATTRWLRARTPLPVWWAEFYPEPAAGAPDVDDPTSAARSSATLAAVAALARAGTATALLWQPQADPPFPYAALWTPPDGADGGDATALTAAWSWLVPRLAAGTVDLGRSPDGRALGFRAADGVLVVDTGGAGLDVGGVDVPAYGSAVLAR